MDLTNQEDVERTIMKNNEENFPFLQFFLASEFGFKGLTTAAQAALMAGVYFSNHPIDSHTREVIEQLVMPHSVRESGQHNMEKNTSCYPAALSFSTMSGSY